MKKVVFTVILALNFALDASAGLHRQRRLGRGTFKQKAAASCVALLAATTTSVSMGGSMTHLIAVPSGVDRRSRFYRDRVEVFVFLVKAFGKYMEDDTEYTQLMMAQTDSEAPDKPKEMQIDLKSFIFESWTQEEYKNGISFWHKDRNGYSDGVIMLPGLFAKFTIQQLADGKAEIKLYDFVEQKVLESVIVALN